MTTVTRDELRELHAGTTPADVAFALLVAETPLEVDQAAHLSLLLFDVAGTFNPIDEHGLEFKPLHDLVFAARHRVHGFHGTDHQDLNDVLDENARIRRAAAARDAREHREQKIRGRL